MNKTIFDSQQFLCRSTVPYSTSNLKINYECYLHDVSMMLNNTVETFKIMIALDLKLRTITNLVFFFK